MHRLSTRKRRSGLYTAGLGALAMYFFDPDRGRGRRAYVRDKVAGSWNQARDFAAAANEDVRNRTRGLLASIGRGARQDVPDDVLVERIRAKLGRVVSHPSAIDVRVDRGTATVRGPVLKQEHKRLLNAAWAVPGVKAVQDQLEVHEQPGDVPALQGGVAPEDRAAGANNTWAPATRVVAGLFGGALGIYGLKRRALSAPLLALAGIALLARAATNMELKRLLGLSDRRGINVSKSLHIAAPVDEVFAFWSNFENFPLFMRNVRAVRKNQDDSWHWEVAGPLGAPVEWDSYITEYRPNQTLAWATRPDAAVQHAGIVRFEPQDSGTRIDVRLTYNPVVGAVGHAAASLFGADPKTEIDEDLHRFKTYFENGKPARAAGAPSSTQDEGAMRH